MAKQASKYMQEEQETVAVTLDVPVELHRRTKAAAALRGLTLGAYALGTMRARVAEDEHYEDQKEIAAEKEKAKTKVPAPSDQPTGDQSAPAAPSAPTDPDDDDADDAAFAADLALIQKETAKQALADIAARRAKTSTPPAPSDPLIERGVKVPEPLPEHERMSDQSATALIDMLITGDALSKSTTSTTTDEQDVEAALRDAGVLQEEGGS